MTERRSGMLRLEHYDDGKQKYQSHEIRIRDGKFAPSIENDILEVDCLGNSLNCKVIKIY